MKTKRYNWESIIIGILFLIVAILSFTRPDTNLVSIIILFGAVSVLKGIYEFYLAYQLRKYSDASLAIPVVMGIINVLIGVFLLLNLDLALGILPYVFAAWFIIDSLYLLMRASFYKELNSGYYYFCIFSGILGVIVGILLLFKPAIAALSMSYMISAFFALFGIMYLIDGFIGRRNKLDEL